jgi:GAF domain-containing protein
MSGFRSAASNDERRPVRRTTPVNDRQFSRASGSENGLHSSHPRPVSQQWHRIVDSLGVIASLIREQNEMDDLAAALTAGASQAVGADMAILRIADLDTRTLETRVIHGFSHRVKDALLGRSTSLYDARKVLASPRCTQFALAEGPPNGFTRREYEEVTNRGITHVLSVPLLRQGMLIGRLDLMTACGAPFSDEQQTISEALAAIIASTLSDASGPGEVDTRIVTTRLNPPSFEDITDAREMFQYLVQWIDEMIGCRQCYGFIWNETKEVFSPVAVSGGQPDAVQALKEIHLRPEAVPALREAIHNEAPYIIPDARETSLFPPEMVAALDLQRVIILSLRGSAGQLVGSVILDFEHQRELTDTFNNVVNQAGNYTSIMLENALLYEAV